MNVLPEVTSDIDFVRPKQNLFHLASVVAYALIDHPTDPFHVLIGRYPYSTVPYFCFYVYAEFSGIFRLSFIDGPQLPVTVTFNTLQR